MQILLRINYFNELDLLFGLIIREVMILSPKSYNKKQINKANINKAKILLLTFTVHCPIHFQRGSKFGRWRPLWTGTKHKL